jgi:hypothetical protein
MRYPAAVPDYPISGGCLCGAVRFEISEPLTNAGYCHCTRCQRRTGTAASAQARIPRGALRILQGEERVAAFLPGDGGFAKLFCGACGSALFSRSQQQPEVMSVRLGALDVDPELPIEWRQYVAYAAPWEPIPDDGVPRYDEARPRTS